MTPSLLATPRTLLRLVDVPAMIHQVVAMVSKRARSSSTEQLSPRRLRLVWRLASMALTAAAVSACSLAQPSSPGPSTAEATHDRATVERVIDGDTVDLRIASLIERVRLIGVDTPESVAPHVPDQCFGAEAAAALADLLPTGTEVDISRDVEARDRYGRLLLYLHRTEDGLFVNQWLVAGGFAAAVSYEPNTAHQLTLAEAERTATSARAGLWGACDGPDQPLDPN